MRRFLYNMATSSLLTLLLFGLYPAAFLLSQNWFMYSPAQRVTLLAATPLMVGLLGLALYGVLVVVARVPFLQGYTGRINLSWTSFRDIFFAVFGCVTMFWLLWDVNVALIGKAGLVWLIVLASVFLLFFVVRNSGPILVNTALLVMIVASLLQWGISFWAFIAIRSTEDHGAHNELRDKEPQFVMKPNTYFITVEALQDPGSLEKVYNIDTRNIHRAFTEREFTVLRKCYSNYSYTLYSLASLFDMQHHYYDWHSGYNDSMVARGIIGGVSGNRVLKIWRNNGYRIQYVLHNDYCFFPGGALDYYFPRRNLVGAFEAYQSEYVNRALLSLFSGYRPAYGRRIGGRGDDEIIARRLRIASASVEPYFTFLKVYYPGHFHEEWNNIQSPEKWYRERAERAFNEILLLVDQILEMDPGALIVVCGDHGPWRWRGAWRGDGDVNEVMKRNGITPAEVASDLFGTFVALRLPADHPVELDRITHVNLFRYIAGILSRSRFFHDTKAADDSYFCIPGRGLQICIRDGIPLERWQVHQRGKNP